MTRNLNADPTGSADAQTQAAAGESKVIGTEGRSVSGAADTVTLRGGIANTPGLPFTGGADGLDDATPVGLPDA